MELIISLVKSNFQVYFRIIRKRFFSPSLAFNIEMKNIKKQNKDLNEDHRNSKMFTKFLLC